MGIAGYFSVLAVILAAGTAISMGCFFYRRSRLALLALGATLVVGGIWYSLVIVDKVANVLFFHDDTVYAPGYSDQAFRGIKNGQSVDAILALLGRPIDKSQSWNKSSEYWYYSRKGTRYPNYWNKIVIFDARTRCVIRKIDELYSR